MSFVNKKSGSTPVYEFIGTFPKETAASGKKSLRGRIVETLKNIALYLPVALVAWRMEKYLFPKKASFFGSLNDNGKGISHFDFDYEYVKNPYNDSQLFLKNGDNQTHLKYAEVKPNWIVNKVPRDATKRQLILYFQGNGQTLDDFDTFKSHYTDTNTLFMMLDWPKHGQSEGVLNHATMHQQAELAYQFAIQKLGYREDEICVKGVSLGCYQALSLAKQHPKIRELELEAPFSTMEKISRADQWSTSSNFWLRQIGHLVQRAIRRYYNFNQMDGLEKLKQFEGKVHIIRRTRDSLTSLDAKHLAQSSLSNPIIKRIVEEKFGHTFSHSSKAERERWMDDYLAQEHLEKTLPIHLTGDQKQLVELLQEFVEDQAIDISGKTKN